MPGKSPTTPSELIQTVTRLNRLISQRTGRTRPDQTFTQLQHETLKFLSLHRQPGVGQVAKHLGVSLPSTAQLLRRLQKAGWITRSIDTHDRRRVTVHLTNRGQAYLKRLDGIRTERLSKLFRGVTVAQLRTMAEVMRAMYHNAANHH